MEDLVQEVLVKLVRKLPTYERRENKSFRGWLFQVTVNQCRDFRRRKATRPLPGDDGLAAVADSATVPNLEEEEYRRLLIRRALDLVRPDFNDQTWAAFVGVMVEGRAATEVAVTLGISVNAVYLARNRVLTRLREDLDGFVDLE